MRLATIAAIVITAVALNVFVCKWCINTLEPSIQGLDPISTKQAFALIVLVGSLGLTANASNNKN